MMPIGDDNSKRKATPIVTYLLILFNVLFFFLEIAEGESFIYKWAFTPANFLANPIGNIPNLFSSMFMHAGFGHLFGNMLYLWIFGDNVEDFMGKIKYLLFYLFCGLLATFTQLFFIPNSTIPNLGASGAIAGVLGAYIVLFPQEKVRVIFGASLVEWPSLIVIGFWFVLQFFSSFSPEASSGESGGVAYMAHIGGFIAGLAIAGIVKATQKNTSS